MMRKISTFFALIFFVTVSVIAQTPRNVDSRDFAVMLKAEVQTSPPAIKIGWAKNELANQYRIFKKKINDNNWDFGLIATLDSNTFEFIDNNVQIGIAYEYEVWAFSLGSAGGPFNFWAFGYILTGIDVAEYDQQGNVLLLIDSTLQVPLSNEIIRLKQDLRAEGWGIIEKYVPRTEAFDKAAVKKVKQIIMDEYAKDAANLKSIYILGRVAVPYSGNMNPDAHPDHLGAWPADIYYGYTINEMSWSDILVNNPAASREANRNIPGDGKFDNNIITTDNAKIAVGRVDMFGMKQFLVGEYKTETDLIKKYLDKNHKYRAGEMSYTYSGIIDDNFPASGTLEAFASSGWRNFGSLVGAGNVKKADWFTALGTESHLFAYGCGGGSYTSAGGIGNTSDFVTKPVNAVFTLLFGSYFGDWDADNNFLRAPLASDPMALTCAWAGRPHWYLHHMAYGYPIGYSALVSHNNTDLYKPNIVYTSQYPNGVYYTIGMKNTHTALMGDPTLRMNPYKVPSPANVNAIQLLDNDGKAYVKISWSPAETDENLHYNVYRSKSEFGNYKKINQSPVTTEQFIDDLAGEDFYKFDGELYYMVRTVMLETNNSGRYYNISRGEINHLTVSEVNDNEKFAASLCVSPNPASENAEISFTVSGNSNVEVDVVDINGNVVIQLFSGYLSAGWHNTRWDLKNNMKQFVPAGVYLVKVYSGREILVQKVSVIK